MKHKVQKFRTQLWKAKDNHQSPEYGRTKQKRKRQKRKRKIIADNIYDQPCSYMRFKDYKTVTQKL